MVGHTVFTAASFPGRIRVSSADDNHAMRRSRGILRFVPSRSSTTPGAIPLVALLGRRLTDHEVAELAVTITERARLRGDDTIPEVDVVVAITVLTDQLPTTREIDRVREAVQLRGYTVQRRVPLPT